MTDLPPGGPGGPGIDFEALREHTVSGVLDIETVEASPDRVVVRVPVTWRVHQPYGILHGGVSALLAETAASYGGALSAPPGRYVVGIELNASHLRPMREGTLTASATPVRKGRTLQVWDVALTDDAGRDICRARCTLAVIETAGPGAPGSGAPPPGSVSTPDGPTPPSSSSPGGPPGVD